MSRLTYVYGKLPAQDVQRARRFYQETLGLSPFAEHNNHLYYEAAGVRFLIFPSVGAPSGTHDQLGLVVEDLRQEMADLRSAGVVFQTYPGVTDDSGIMAVTRPGVDQGTMKAAWFKDSEGNLISLAENAGIVPETNTPTSRASIKR